MGQAFLSPRVGQARMDRSRFRGHPGPASPSSTERWRRYMERVRASPERIRLHRLQGRERNRKWRERKMMEKAGWMGMGMGMQGEVEGADNDEPQDG
ncbi:hypothetical protein ACOMHN_036032 [Nucella lapillus]